MRERYYLCEPFAPFVIANPFPLCHSERNEESLRLLRLVVASLAMTGRSVIASTWKVRGNPKGALLQTTN